MKTLHQLEQHSRDLGRYADGREERARTTEELRLARGARARHYDALAAEQRQRYREQRQARMARLGGAK